MIIAQNLFNLPWPRMRFLDIAGLQQTQSLLLMSEQAQCQYHRSLMERCWLMASRFERLRPRLSAQLHPAADLSDWPKKMDKVLRILSPLDHRERGVSF